MTKTLKALEQLVAMAINTKGDKRGNLFHAVTELYLENSGEFDVQERTLFGEVIGAVLYDVDVDSRTALSQQLAEQDSGPHNLAKKLLSDDTVVCLPLLRDCAWLNDDELVTDLDNRGPEEIEALGDRANLSKKVSTAIIQSGHLPGIRSLLRNTTAQVDARDLRKVVDATADLESALTELIEENETLPLHLANMFFHVTHCDRLRILQRLKEDFDAKDGINAPISQSGTKVAPDVKVERDLIGALRAEDHETFQKTFAEAVNIDDVLAKRILDDEGAEALAVACKSQSFQRATFSTFALLVSPAQQRSPQQITRLMSLYGSLDPKTAQYVVQLWLGNTASLAAQETNAA